MDTSKLSNSLRGNQNAAGPHKKTGPAAKPSNLKKGIKTTAGWVRDSAVLGAGAGALMSHQLAKGLGMKTAKSSLTKVAVRGALTGARAAGPVGLAIGAGVTAAGAYKDYKDKQRSVKGRAIAARNKIVAVAKKAVKAVKG